MPRARARLVIMLAAGVVAAAVTAVLGTWETAVLVGWAVAAGTFCAIVWARTWRLDPAQTKSHALREDPSRATTDLLLLGANVASLIAVGLVLVEARSATGARQGVLAGLVVLSVALSWLLVQTLFTLRYALLYYGDPEGGISFNSDDPPQYSDFAYLSFTMGMTFQVSDTNLSTKKIRATVLRHALLSYLFSSVILATTVNLIAGLSG